MTSPLVSGQPNDISSLIKKLEAWTEHDFHKDRQLSDEVLIADGWKVEANADFEGGVRWFFGRNPEVSTSESGRPHVIHDLNTALDVVPRGYSLCLMLEGGMASAVVWRPGERGGIEGKSELATIAVLIAALKTKHELMSIQ